MGIAGKHAGQQGQRWWHRQGVRYWYALGIAFLLAGMVQIGLSVGGADGDGPVMVGIVYLLIGAGWFAIGLFKHRREPSDAARH